MLRFQSCCVLWLWLLPLICCGAKFNLFNAGRGSGVQEGDVRLAGSSRQSEGRVEIYHHGQWGTICDDGWDLNEAQVVCRQLNFPGAKSVTTGVEIYGKATGPIWMDDMQCSGTERFLRSCNFKGWGVTDCTHKEDVGVVCESRVDDSLPDSSHILDHRVVLSEELGELFDSGTFCDLPITAQSSSPEDQTGAPQITDTTLCAHKSILLQVPSFNITEDTRNITVQVVHRCLPHFSSFIRYLYTRKIEVTFSSVQCLHWLASKFGVNELMKDSSLLFNQILPEDNSFETAVSVHEYSVETKDLGLQEICVQFMAWNFQKFSQTPAWTHISVDLLSSILIRSDIVVSDEWFVLQAVENWFLNNANISLETKAKVLSLVRFPMIPDKQLTTIYMLANSSLYSTHNAIYDENIFKALQFNVQLFINFKAGNIIYVDDICYQPRIYTTSMWSKSFGPFPVGNNEQVRSFSTPFHSSLMLQDRRASWLAEIFLTEYQCSNRGMKCQSLPMARLTSHDSRGGVVFQNKLVLMCEDKYIGQVQDFKNQIAYISQTPTQSMTYPCRKKQYRLLYVVRPEFLVKTFTTL